MRNFTVIGVLGLLASVVMGWTLPAQEPLFASSVVGTEFDFIRDEDPSAFVEMNFVAKQDFEMPDKRGDRELFQPAFVFQASYAEGTVVKIALDEAFEDEASARAEAERYATRLGRIPEVLRRGVDRIVVHRGGPETTAFSDIGLIVVYSANASRRIATHDLEETLFHESVHATWDKAHARSAAWQAAQESDGAFVTRYARSKPEGEDLAETALFSFALHHHPERLPAATVAALGENLPARLRYLSALWEGESKTPLPSPKVKSPEPLPAPAEVSPSRTEREAWLLEIIAALLAALVILKLALLGFLIHWRYRTRS
jgi:hypothetical protein